MFESWQGDVSGHGPDHTLDSFSYAALFAFAHRVLWAAAILLRPAAVIVGFGLAVLCFARRAFCVKLILRRAAANIFRDAPLVRCPPRAANAALIL